MKRFRLILSLLLMAVLVAGLLPVLPVSAAEDSTGEVGSCTWTYADATKTLTITPKEGGDGKTVSNAYSESNVPFASVAGSVENIVIHEGVTSLGDYLFVHFSALTSVTFPQNSLTTIGEGAFRGCTSLTAITIPDSVESIGRALFYDCAELETVTLGGSYTAIPGIAFGVCPKLTTVTIPASVTSVTMDVSASGIKRGVFYNSPNVTTINYGGTKAQWEALVNGLTEGSSDVTLLSGTGVTVVCADDITASGEVGNCTWTYVEATKTLTITPKAGGDGKTVSNAYSASNVPFASVAGSVENIVIHEGVTSLGDYLFVHFSALTSVTFPQNSLTTIGEGTFRGCDALVSITIPDSVTSIGRSQFYDCAKLETVTLGGSYTAIPGIAFGVCPKLTTVTIPASVTSFTMDVSASGIKRGVFYNSPNLTTINYGGTKAQWEALLDGLAEGSSDIALLKSSDVTVTCSNGTYIYGRNDITPETLGQPVAVAAASGTTSKYFNATIEAGKVYKLTARWNTAPTMTGVQSEWEIESWTGLGIADTMCETLFQVTKREKEAAGTTTVAAEIIFTAQKDATALVMNVQNLNVDNSITVDLEESSLGEDVISDAVIYYDANTDLGGNAYDIVLEADQKYTVEVEWAETPYHRGADSGGAATAWKVQPLIDEEFWGTNMSYNFTARATGTTPVAVQKKYTGSFTADGSYTMFSFYAQRVCAENSVHVVVKEDNSVPEPFTVPVDYVTTEKLISIPWLSDGGHGGNYLQGLEIYNDIVFVTYDGGYVRTYDFKTGEFIQEFRMECALESNHASGTFFSNYKYAEDDPFPLLYVSADKSTLGCYVERITYDDQGNFQSEMVQFLDFSTLKGWKDGQPTSEGIHSHASNFVLLERDTDTIVYVGRELSDIADPTNRNVLAHFSLPACKEGNTAGKVYEGGYTIVGESATDTITVDCPVVHFTNDDILDVANAELNDDGYYYWNYFGRTSQGACTYRGKILWSHGVSRTQPNNWGDKTFYTGIMNYDYDSDKMSRFLDVTGSIGWYGEPQGLLVYQGRLLHIMAHEGYGVYEVKIKLDGLEDSYDVGCCATVDDLKTAIAAAVKPDLDAAFSVEAVTLPENFAITGADQTFTAKVTVYTTWNSQVEEITVNLDGHTMTNHAADPATCTEDGTVEYWSCSVCQKNYGDKDGTTVLAAVVDAADGHALVKTEAKAATTEAEGNIAYYTCQVCEKLFSDAAGKTAITKADTVIPKLEPGTDPTEESKPSEETKPTEETKPSNGSPATGEAFHLAPMLLLMAVSAFAVWVTAKKREY